MFKRIICFLIIFNCAFCLYATEKDPQEEPKEQQGESSYTPLRKISRGLTNTAFCWMEIPRQTIKVKKERGEKAGILLGPLKGLAYTFGRCGVGIYEIVTFLVPPYKPLIDPEFVFSEKEEEKDAGD